MLAKKHWTTAVLDIADLLDRKKAPDRSALWIAKAVFNEARDLTVRSQTLYFMSPVIADQEDHKAFIYNTLNRYSHETGVVKSALRTLNAFYLADVGTFNILLGYLDHPQIAIANTALRGLLVSRHFRRASDRILRAVIASGESVLRRKFVQRVAIIEGGLAVPAAREHGTRDFIDFNEPVSERSLAQMASLNSKPPARSFPNEAERKRSEQQAIRLLTDEYRKALERIQRRFKVPFKFDHPARV
jgi:hypothetical protein